MKNKLFLYVFFTTYTSLYSMKHEEICIDIAKLIADTSILYVQARNTKNLSQVILSTINDTIDYRTLPQAFGYKLTDIEKFVYLEKLQTIISQVIHEQKITSNIVVEALNIDQIIDQCIKHIIEKIALTFNWDIAIIKHYICLDKLSIVIKYMLMGETVSFEYLLNIFKFDALEQNLAFRPGFIKETFHTPVPEQKRAHNLSQLLAIFSLTNVNSLKIIVATLGTAITGWSLLHAVCHTCAEALEPQKWWSGGLIALLAAGISYKLVSKLHETSITNKFKMSILLTRIFNRVFSQSITPLDRFLATLKPEQSKLLPLSSIAQARYGKLELLLDQTQFINSLSNEQIELLKDQIVSKPYKDFEQFAQQLKQEHIMLINPANKLILAQFNPKLLLAEEKFIKALDNRAKALLTNILNSV